MANITLEVQSAKLTSEFGRHFDVSHDGKWAITSVVKLHWPERLELGSGEDIGRPGRSAEIEMHLTFRAIKPELVEWATERTKNVDDTFKRDDDVVCRTASYQAERNSRDGLDHNPASILLAIIPFANPFPNLGSADMTAVCGRSRASSDHWPWGSS